MLSGNYGPVSMFVNCVFAFVDKPCMAEIMCIGLNLFMCWIEPICVGLNLFICCHETYGCIYVCWYMVSKFLSGESYASKEGWEQDLCFDSI
jgi:hypothetical protein